MNTPIPLDDIVKPGEECRCEFTPYDEYYPDPDDPSCHYLRRCAACGNTWYSLHCPHDGHQNKCSCGARAPQIPET